MTYGGSGDMISILARKHSVAGKTSYGNHQEPSEEASEYYIFDERPGSVILLEVGVHPSARDFLSGGVQRRRFDKTNGGSDRETFGHTC